MLKASSCKDYSEITQLPFESLADYKIRYDLSYQAYLDTLNPRNDDEDVAMHFLEPLDKGWYLDFVIDILNDIDKDAIVEPVNAK